MEDRRVLVAEDDADNRRMLCSLLRSWGYEPLPAVDGEEALAAMLPADGPSIALLDWMMPVHTGPEICQKVRAERTEKPPYLILLTARTQAQDVVFGLEAGANDYVRKPFDFAELRARLAKGVKSTEPKPEEEELKAGSVIGGRWRLDHLIAEGGMGAVWKGCHVSLDHEVAIKLIRAEYVNHPDARRRFETEARATSRIRTRYAAQVHDYGTTAGGVPFLVMEYLRGQTLGEAIDRHGAMTIQEVATIISHVARGLSVAHEEGIIHRDVKPDNVFLAEAPEDSLIGAPYIAKLIDFGIARRGDPSRGKMTGFGVTLGTLGYSSPEQLAGSDVGPLADVWSMGALAYTAAVGQEPLHGLPDDAVMARIVRGVLPVPSEVRPDLPKSFDAWFEKCCAADPAERFESAMEASRALKELADGATTRSVLPSRPMMQLEGRVSAPRLIAAQTLAPEIALLEESPKNRRAALAAMLALMVAIGFLVLRVSI